jgi:hypothetical protein
MPWRKDAQARISEASAGTPAEDGAQRHRFAMMLVFVYGFILFTLYLSFTDSRMLPSYGWVGWQNYETCSDPALGHRDCQPGVFARSTSLSAPAFIGLMLAIFLDQKIRGEGHAAADLSLSDGAQLHRHRHGVEMVPRPGIGSRHTMHLWGWESFTFDWIKDRDYAIYTDRHRRRLADQRVCHGDVPGRPARHRQRDAQGRADGRRLELEALSPDHHSAASAGLPVGLRDPQPPRDQVL